jgi:murein DD-endopeptidase MepM/ murein hydrolase activator NlpD
VKDPQIASSGVSGKKGGTYGCTRINPNSSCHNVRGLQYHDGLDIKAVSNSNLYSMCDGEVVSVRNSFAPGQYKFRSFGNFVVVRSQINGNTVYIKFNHLNSVSVSKGQLVSAGDLLGLSGTTGNAAAKGVTPHVHIEVFDSSWNTLNPQDYLTTQFDSNYNAISSSNCN